MIDLKFLRENPEIVKQNIKNKFQDQKLPLVDEVIELDAKARATQKEADELRASRNTLSKQIGQLMGQGKKEEAEAVKAQVSANAARLAELEETEKELQEKVTKIMMTSLLIIMIILAVNSFFMDGAKEGLAFYLIPDFERMKQIGIAKTITGAMNQAFFTLSLGIGAMAIWGSYIGKERSLLGESVNIAILDTFVAITSGLIIFPACFTFHVDQTSGPSLIFITLPNIFNHIPLGRLWGSLFFLFMFFAAFSTILAVFENIISCGMELTGCSRQKSCAVNLVLIIVLSLPCVLGYNVWNWKGFSIFGGSVLDLEDFLVSNLFLPLGSLVYLLFCTSR